MMTIFYVKITREETREETGEESSPKKAINETNHTKF